MTFHKTAILLVGFLAVVAQSTICRLKDNAKYDLSKCDENTDTASVFVYYDKELGCNMLPNKSDPLPPYIQGLQCEQFCDDGEYLALNFKNLDTPYLNCSKCPANAISAAAGLIYNAKMDTANVFPDPTKSEMANFKTSCLAIDMTDPNTQREGRISSDCLSWKPNGNSLIA